MLKNGLQIKMKKNLEFKKIFFISLLLLNFFLIHAETLKIEKIESRENLQIAQMNQFSDEEFNFYDEEDGKLKNQELIYWIVLSGLILLFIVVLSYTIYRIFKRG